MNMKFQEKAECGGGSLIIENLAVRPFKGFDPLAKIWSSVRKRNRECYGVDVAGIFQYMEDQPIIICAFFLNYCGIEEAKIDLHNNCFATTFQRQMIALEEALLAFMKDDNGFAAYSQLINSPEFSMEKAEQLFDDFLKSVNIKTEEDEVEKRKRRKCANAALSFSKKRSVK